MDQCSLLELANFYRSSCLLSSEMYRRLQATGPSPTQGLLGLPLQVSSIASLLYPDHSWPIRQLYPV